MYNIWELFKSPNICMVVVACLMIYLYNVALVFSFNPRSCNDIVNIFCA